MRLVVLPYPCLQLADSFEVQLSVLVAFNILLGVLAHLKENLCVLLLIDLQLVLQSLYYLLLHLVQEHCGVLRESFGKGGCLE